MDNIKSLIRTIPDFPKQGIEFRDLSTLFLDGPGFNAVVEAIAEHRKDTSIDLVAGVEARGFIIGAPVALRLGKGFVPVRKPGKLPGETIAVEYTLEYGTDKLEIHADAIPSGAKVLIVDDLLATGGTMQAACSLVEQAGGNVVGCSFIVELVDLHGRQRISQYNLHKLVDFEGE